MRRFAALVVLVALPVVLFVGPSAADSNGNGKRGFSARLSGYEEVLAISTIGRGAFVAHASGNEISFRLLYSDLGTPSAAPSTSARHRSTAA